MRAVFVVNPLSGGKDKDGIVEKIRRECVHSCEIVFTERPGHATLIAEESDADAVVAVGGDGTVSEVARGLMGSKKALGIIPCGSGDGLALHLGIPRNIHKAIGIINSAKISVMDSGSLGGKPFFCTFGVGFDAEVAWSFSKAGTRGIWTYISEAWKTWKGFEPETYEIKVDDILWKGPAAMVTVGNVNQWGNNARITSLASVTDGLLDVTVVSPFHTFEIPVLAAKLMDGRAHTSRRVRMFKGRHIEITRSKEGPAHIDGDPFMQGSRLIADIVPSALNVLVPSRYGI